MATEGWKRAALRTKAQQEMQTSKRKKQEKYWQGHRREEKWTGWAVTGEFSNGTGFCFPVFKMVSKPSQVQGYPDIKERH